MRRSTAAAVGTLTGAALIVGVRLSVQPPAPPAAAPSQVNLVDNPSTPKPTATGAASKKPSNAGAKKPAEKKGAFKDGVFKGKAVKNIYGTIQVSIKVDEGKITAAEATYPLTGNSATINPPAIAALKQETLKVENAGDNVDAVSGATYTSQSYQQSLQSALDSAKA
ncbi:FMN-binding protein [Paractinoplanes rhizophilus]|uniref:FMN-binding protein n=1 Tax=Paractinoplanes rhizophilus TaxID=1416877 RepID=A0ABW2I1I3_9ACTN|nr:FMN-binding protein [Actinoplanes sp.]